MKGTQGCKRRLAAFLTAAAVLGCGLSMTGASYAAGTGAGSAPAGNTADHVQNRTVHFAYITGYPDGEVKPLGKITREEAAVIFYRLMTQESRNTCAAAAHDAAAQLFSDVDAGRWSNVEIAALYDAGVIQGYGDGSFRPSSLITRAEFAAMAARFGNLGEAQDNRFPDIEGHWAVNDINAAAEKGWIRAYGDLSFRPETPIIRCEAMMWINDAQDRIVNIVGLHKDAKQWPDNAEDQWYYEIVLEAGNTHDYERITNRPKATERWTAIEENPVWE